MCQQSIPIVVLTKFHYLIFRIIEPVSNIIISLSRYNLIQTGDSTY